MSFASKKQESQEGDSQHKQIHIHVDRNTVNSASRQTGATINQMTDQIAREVSKQIDDKK